MSTWKKLITLLAALLVAGALGAGGAAWAGSGDASPESGAGQAPDPDATTAIVAAGPTETHFVPVAPCRLVDTRVAGGRLADREIRRYDVGGDGATFAAQGGTAGGCDIPPFGFSAVEITVTAVDTTGTGFIRIFPAGVGDATFMNYTPDFNASNTGTVVTCEGSDSSCDPAEDLGVRNYGTTTHLVIDVQGYYAKPITAVVSAGGGVERGSRYASATKINTGQYRVTFSAGDLSACTFVGSIGSGTPSGTFDGEIQVQQNASDDEAAYVATFDSDGALADRDFMVHVVC